MSGTLRVIHVVTPDFGHNFSGHYLYVSSLLRRWKVEGISLSSLGSGWEGSNTKCLDSGEHGAFSEHSWMSSRTSGRFSRMMWSLRLLINLVRTQSEYDILHFHALNWGSLLSPGVAHIWGKKAIYTITRQGYDNPSAIASGRSGRLKVMLFKNYDGIIGLAPALLEDCRSHHCTSHLELLPSFMIVEELENGRDDPKRSAVRARWGLSPDGCAILFVGSIIPRKGADSVVDLFIRLAQEDRDIRLFLVGPVNRQESSKLDMAYVARQKKKLELAGMESRAHWVGLVRDSALLADYYHMADIFVLPTKSEGSPQVFAEAMAAGLPVVTTRLPGITDASVIHGENGYLVDDGDLDGLTEAVRALSRDEGLRNRMGAAARRRMLHQFHFTSYCARLAAFYRLVAGQSRGDHGRGNETGVKQRDNRAG